MMYAKIFRQVFDSSLADDPEAMRVFIYMCVLADQDGVVDMTLRSISQITRIPVDEVERAIRKLIEPDPMSRSPKEKGARLMLIDPSHRDSGWRIVNFKHYGSLQSEEDRRSHFRGKRPCRRSRWIYYAVSGGEVKIGLTVNPAARIAKLKESRHDVELTAKEIGSEELLRRRRSEFANDHVCNGWFRITRKIQEHISRIAAANPRSQSSNGSARITRCSTDEEQDTNGSTDESATPQGKRNIGVAPGNAGVTEGSAKNGATETEVEVYDSTPLSSPHGETVEEQNISFEETKSWLNSLFGRHKPWSSEENSLLRKLLPISKEVRALLSWGYTLVRDAEGWAILDGKKLTKPKQNLLALLRGFSGEIEKWHSVRANLHGVQPDPVDDGWTEERLTACKMGFPKAVFAGPFNWLPVEYQGRIDARVKQMRATQKDHAEQ